MIRRLVANVWHPLPLRFKSLAVVAIPLVPLVAIVLIVAGNRRLEREADDWVIHTQRVKGALHRALVLTVDAESSVRGFVLSGERSWLQPYEQARIDWPEAASALCAVVRDNPVAVERCARVRRQIDARFTALARLLPYAAPARPPESSLIEGYEIMEALRAELDAMATEEDRLLADRHGRVAAVRDRTNQLTVLATLFALAGGVVAIWLFVGGIARRAERVSQNATHLAHAEPLPGGPSTVQDELGDLDRALHEAAVLLDARMRDVQSAREELDRFFSLSLDMLCIADVGGRFQRMNPAWHETLGWTTADLSATPYLEFVHPDDHPETRRQMKLLADGGTVVSFENRYRCKDGSYRWLSWKAAAHLEQDRVFGAARDVTERKKAEQALREQAMALAAAQLEAERANRAKTHFLSHMSHDLRTPLNAILGFAQVLEAERLSEDQRDSVLQIIRGGQHLLDMISEVLDITRIEAGQVSLSPEAVLVHDVIERAVDLVTPLAAQRQICLEVPTISRDVAVMADRQRVHQVLLNLLSNAVKYNRFGGRITIALEDTRDGWIRLAVTDTGAGLSEEKLALLFQPFERLGAEQTTTEGTGLGLMLCRRLAEAMGGIVGVRSVVDRGSTFWLELPGAAPPVVAAVAVEAAPTPIGTRQATTGVVLYIEDNYANTRLMQRILQQQRPLVTLLTASQGEAGIVMAREHRPDLVFLDLHLPDMTGEDILQRLWNDPQTRPIPMVMLTADVTPGLARRLKVAGACDHLSKPLNMIRVLALVDQFLTARPSEDMPAPSMPTDLGIRSNPL